MLQEGQRLWYVPADRRYLSQSTEVEVKSIGRKWATIDKLGKVDLETLWVDGGKYSSPGRCWISKEVWETEMRRIEVWRDLQNRLSHHPPDNVPETTIREIAKTLGIKLKD